MDLKPNQEGTMHMPPPSPEELVRAIELGHEPSTVSVKGIAWFFVIFFAFGAVVFLLVWVMYRQMVKSQEAADLPRSALVSVKIYPPEPRLQPTKIYHERTEPEDLALMNGRENLEFVRRGWINEDNGEFRIPDDVVNTVAQQASGGAGVTK
jgi:hypothetical protein